MVSNIFWIFIPVSGRFPFWLIIYKWVAQIPTRECYFRYFRYFSHCEMADRDSIISATNETWIQPVLCGASCICTLYPLVNDHIAGWNFPIFNRTNIDSIRGPHFPASYVSLLECIGFAMILSCLMIIFAWLSKDPSCCVSQCCVAYIACTVYPDL